MIEVKNLVMQYGKTEVLKNISFHIEEGSIVGLLGANGAGKSTTMNILTGYLKPLSGEVTINGLDMRKNPKQAKQKIGYLPELPPLYMDMRVVDYLIFSAELKGIKNRKEEVDRVIDFANLEDYRIMRIKKLSKGLQQRVGFAQALLGNPPVLLLDEPLVGLDPQESKRIREYIRELGRDHSIIISSHILSEIEELCGEILMLRDGALVMHESTSRAKKKGKQNVYRLTVKGKREKICACLDGYQGVSEHHFVEEKESGVFTFVIKGKDKRDLRDSMVSFLTAKGFLVYGIEKVESSLEDVFMEMNGKEEA